MNSLKNKTAVITGASSGIGKAIAELFVLEGANVVVSDLNQQSINDVIANMKHQQGSIYGKVCNVTLENEVSDLINFSKEQFGTVDILMNNAGVMDDFMPIDKVSNELMDRVMKINFYGPFYASRLVVPLMLEQGSGVIINIASIGGLFGGRAGAVYTASKHALIGLTKNIGFMYAQKGIRCNAIAPGAINTNIGKEMHPDLFGFERFKTGQASMPHIGEAIDIARVALFLAGNDSSYINGSVITADGSWSSY